MTEKEFIKWLNNFVKTETGERVKVKQVEFREHGKNSAIYSE